MINILAVVGGAYLVSSFLSTVCPVSRERERERERVRLCVNTHSIHYTQHRKHRVSEECEGGVVSRDSTEY